ncbi:hypothetical protein ACFL5Q_03150 [Planctomycetota bacterium]
MLCPFCLSKAGFEQQVEGPPGPRCRNADCAELAPALYVQDYRKYPPVVVSAVGFREHGKTVYFAALFYAMKKLKLAQHWLKFFTMGLTEESLQTVYENVGMLERGELPDANPKNFPRPTIVRVTGVPIQPDATLLCYDTGGECFERPTQLIKYASFVKRAQTAMFLISVPNLEDPVREMHRLLETYAVGMSELQTNTKYQHLVVVYTKADMMIDRLARWVNLSSYLREGSMDGMANPQHYMSRLRSVSNDLRDFTGKELGAYEFVNAARQSFRSVEYTIVSALGAEPIGRELPVQIAPRRVLDPLFWLMEKSLPGWRRVLRSWLLG